MELVILLKGVQWCKFLKRCIGLLSFLKAFEEAF